VPYRQHRRHIVGLGIDTDHARSQIELSMEETRLRSTLAQRRSGLLGALPEHSIVCAHHASADVV